MIEETLTAMIKNAVILGIFALLSTGLIGGTYLLTQDRISLQESQQLSRRLDQIVAPESHDNNLIDSCQLVQDKKALGTEIPVSLFLATKDNKLTGGAIEAVAPDGYSGEIRILIGFDQEANVSGVRILRHQETPGLGDKISKRITDWVDGFIGKKPENQNDPVWAVKKDGGEFDQFTGATITPRAVVKAVKKASLYYQSHQDDFLSLDNPCGGDAQ